ncbi:unnamed protein product [Ranitomeya imitator]|uniref:Uncharacterized protein n=1 Tax=Ranitomeya imitator TaxID=111125 RepID=A0ABN9LNX8_9NEOB|nr:unnamed protein product [Ranitomeya imitator]
MYRRMLRANTVTFCGRADVVDTDRNESLDITLIRHLQYCSELIKQIVTSGEALFVLRDLKKKLSRQSQVIKQLSDISKDNMGQQHQFRYGSYLWIS